MKNWDTLRPMDGAKAGRVWADSHAQNIRDRGGEAIVDVESVYIVRYRFDPRRPSPSKGAKKKGRKP